MNLAVIKQIVQAEMSHKRSSPYNEIGDKYAHGERTAALALRLRQLILPNDSSHDDILTVAAWFHDIRNGMANHCELGAQRTRVLLAGHVPADELEQICHIIAVHDNRNHENNFPDLIKIHQDADHLDHFGTLDIWRSVAYTTGNDRTIKNALDFFRDERPAEAKKWRSQLHFDISRRIYDDKEQYMQSFIQRLAVEGAGGIWNEEALLLRIYMSGAST